MKVLYLFYGNLLRGCTLNFIFTNLIYWSLKFYVSLNENTAVIVILLYLTRLRTHITITIKKINYGLFTIAVERNIVNCISFHSVFLFF
jgi:hypothetical protein